MPRYKLTTPAYINEQYWPEGSIVETDLVPGAHMEPAVDEKGREDKDARKAKDAAVKVAQPAPGDPSYLGRLIDHTMNDGATAGAINSASTVPPLVPLPSPGAAAPPPDAAVVNDRPDAPATQPQGE